MPKMIKDLKNTVDKKIIGILVDEEKVWGNNLSRKIGENQVTTFRRLKFLKERGVLDSEKMGNLVLYKLSNKLSQKDLEHLKNLSKLSLSEQIKERLKRELIASYQWLDPRTERQIREYISKKEEISYDELQKIFPMLEGYSSLGTFLILGGLKKEEVKIIFKKRKNLSKLKE
ncbi:hypothetical protein HYT57_02045 [Candidatus Woesearchaeota archaeon]|nr:hypothetical protein [Candidatus Woesearchaeota archaeon]